MVRDKLKCLSLIFCYKLLENRHCEEERRSNRELCRGTYIAVCKVGDCLEPRNNG